MNNLERLSRLSSLPPEPPAVCVCIPARNEEQWIEQAVRSILSQNYPHFHIICANDHSTDRTREILRKLEVEFPSEKLKVIDVSDLPEGWMGKCHALYQAVRIAPQDTSLYLFTDADVIHAPDTLSRAVSQMLDERADLFAIMPRVNLVGYWENAILPLLMHIGILAIDGKKINDPRKRDIAGIGAFTLIRREIYEEWGGHEAIRAEVIDDMAMGMMTKQVGGKLFVAFGGNAVRLRMYHSLGEIVRGFEKNTHVAMGTSLFRSLRAALLFPLLHTLPMLVFVYSLFVGELLLGGCSLAIYLATSDVIIRRIAPFMKLNPYRVTLMYTLGSFAMSGIFMLSAWHGHIGGRVRWRGRSLPLEKQRTKML